jgi:hypothetical protein
VAAEVSDDERFAIRGNPLCKGDQARSTTQWKARHDVTTAAAYELNRIPCPIVVEARLSEVRK